MLCRLCCEECLDFEDLYDNNDQENYIYQICQKFFFRELEKLVKTLGRCSKIICDACWKSINEFNGFYEKIVAQQTEYCNLITGRISLELPEITDSLIMKDVEALKSEYIVTNELLRESSVQRSKAGELEDYSSTIDTFMITAEVQNSSTIDGSEVNDFNASVEIKTEKEFIDDVEENKLEEDDISQSLTNSFLAEQVKDDSDSESRYLEREPKMCRKESPKCVDEVNEKLDFIENSEEFSVTFPESCRTHGSLFKIIPAELSNKCGADVSTEKSLQKNKLHLGSCESQQKQEIDVALKTSNETFIQTKDGNNVKIMKSDFIANNKVPRKSPINNSQNSDLEDNSHITGMSDLSDSFEIEIKEEVIDDGESELSDDDEGSQSLSNSFLAEHNSKESDDEIKNLQRESSLSSPNKFQEKRIEEIKCEILNGKWKVIFRCDLCECSFTKRLKLMQHFKNDHPDNLHSPKFQKPFECEICHRLFAEKKQLRTHYHAHITDLQKYECPECQKRFSCSEYLNKHINCKHSVKDKKWICDLCGVRVSSKQGLNIHKEKKRCKSHLLKLEKKSRYILKMPKIEPKFTNLDPSLVDKATKIIIAASLGKWIPILRCDLCEYSSDGFSMFINHYKQAHPSNLDSKKFQRPFECEICHNSFTQKGILQRHIYTHGNLGEEYQCPYCGKGFAYNGSRRLDALDRHIQSIHSESTWSCDLCGAQLKSKYRLDYHKRKTCLANQQSIFSTAKQGSKT